MQKMIKLHHTGEEAPHRAPQPLVCFSSTEGHDLQLSRTMIYNNLVIIDTQKSS
jgi:hypothetical protein